MTQVLKPALRVLVWLVGMLGGVPLPALGAESAGKSEGRPSLLILGDSIAAGYGVEETEAFPALLQKMADAASVRVEVVNAGVSGDTTAGGLRRLNWLLKRPVDVLLIELGGNDGLRGLAPETTRSNLVAIIDTARRRHPKVQVVLAGMQMPPNLGDEYVGRFAAVFPEVARQKDAVLVPHLLEGVGGRPEMNQSDQIHPTPAGHAVVATNVWRVLKPVLESLPHAR